MKVSIINIGDELLIGQVVNTNATWMSQQLIAAGMDVSKVYTISDNRMDIENTLQQAMLCSDAVIITGGLGPTKDDILMYDYLKYHNMNVCVIATKCDKVGTTLITRHKNDIAKKLNIDKNKVFLTSSLNKIGFEKLTEFVMDFCEKKL